MKSFNQHLVEAKSDYEIYHDTYTRAIEAAVNFAFKNGYETRGAEMHDKIGMGPGRPKVGKTVKHTLTLYKNDKEQRKALQIQVYNRDTKTNTYELNVYIR